MGAEYTFRNSDETSNEPITDLHPLPVQIFTGDGTDSPLTPRYSYKNIATQATSVVKQGAGVLHSIVINTPLASGAATIYDGQSASAPKIGTITLPGTLLTDGPKGVVLDVQFTNGLTVVTSGANVDWTFAYL